MTDSDDEETSFVAVLVLQSICVVSTLFTLLVILPLTISYSRHVWAQRRLSFFCKRNVKLQLFIPFLLIGECTLQSLSEFPTLFPSLRERLSAKQLTMISEMCPLMSTPAQLLRLWFLYFQYQQSVQAIEHLWACEIDGVAPRACALWALRGGWFSNMSRVPYIGAATWAVTEHATFMYFAWHNSEEPSPGHGLRYVSYAILLALAGVIICKVRHTRDNLFIRDELKIFGAIWVGWTVVWIIIVLLLTAFASSDLERILKPTMNSVCRVVVLAMVCHTSTKWVLDKHKRRLDANRRASQKHVELTLFEVVSDKDILELFAQHSARELCLENLLFVMEVTRIQRECVACALIAEPSAEHRKRGDWHFARSIQQPEFAISDVASFFENVHRIHHRFIEEFAEDSINISYETRNALVNAYAPFKVRRLAKRRSWRETGRRLSALMVSPMTMATEAAPERPSVDMKAAAVPLFVALYKAAMRELVRLLQTDSLMRFVASEEFVQLAAIKQSFVSDGVTTETTMKRAQSLSPSKQAQR